MFIDYASYNCLQMNILLWQIIKRKFIKKYSSERVWLFIILMPQMNLGKKYMQSNIKLREKHKIKKLNHILVDFLLSLLKIYGRVDFSLSLLALTFEVYFVRKVLDLKNNYIKKYENKFRSKTF